MAISRGSPLVLGSKSPRRRELLEMLGLPVQVVQVAADETPRSKETPRPYVERVVLAKLDALRSTSGIGDGRALLVADTVVTVGDAILGKPRDIEQAKDMLRMLSGREHEVLTGYAVGTTRGPLKQETVSARVRFRTLTREEVAGYAASGEGLDKAGAYAIQGLGAFAVEHLEGSFSCVVGLPVCEVVVALKETGLLERFP